MELPADPTVFVLLVATDGARWLPDVLRGLRAQTYRPLRALAVDNASTDGSAEMLAAAFGAANIVTLERRVGYGRALAAALKGAGGGDIDADAFLLIHDDTALREGAVEAMVDALRADHVGIVGAKLVEWDDETVLQDIGQTTDRYGRLVARFERGELDQGQHDGVHEVLFVSSAALMIARETVERVGLFDTRYVAMRDDLDLCWRARIAGIRTVLASHASARHASAGSRALRSTPPAGRVRYFADRNMIATLIKNYSLPRLLFALPVSLLVTLVNVVLLALTGRRTSALQALEAMQWNVVHLPATLRGRARAQKARTESDAAVTGLMHAGAARWRAQFERVMETAFGRVPQPTDAELDATPPRLIDRMRAHPGAATMLIGAIVGLVGARALFASGFLSGHDFSAFPAHARDFFTEYASGWRGAGAGGAGPATPGLLLLGALTFVCLGSVWFAQRALLLGLSLVAVASIYRFARAFDLGPSARRIAVVVYITTPLALGTFGAGRLGDLVAIAVAPALLTSLLRAAGVLPGDRWRSAATGVVGLAIGASLSPWLLPMVAGAGVVLAVLVRATRGGSAAAVIRRAAIMTGGAFVLLLPWSMELLRRGSPLGFGGSDPPARMLDVLGLSVAAVRPLPQASIYGLALAALLGLLVAPAARRRAMGMLAGLAFAAVLIGWAVARGVPWIAPRPALPLAVAAPAFAILAGMAFEAAGQRLRARAFGIAHAGVAIVGMLLIAQVVFAAGWIARGNFPGIVKADTLLPSFLVEEAAQDGAFRIAWLDGTAARPHVAMSGPEGATMRQYLARPAGAGARAVERAVGAIAGGSTQTGGRLLATLGVRYVIVRPDAEQSLADAFARQVDLGFFQRFSGATVYRNAIDFPIGSAVGASGWITASATSDLRAAAGAEHDARLGRGLTRVKPFTYTGATPKTTREVLLAEDFSVGWRAETSTRIIPAAPSFGWATRFVLKGGQDVRLTWSGQRWHRAALAGQAFLILAFAAWWSRRAARERGER